MTPGSRLGTYEIVGLLGAGGMGEVYRAHDPRLNRDVAIKVLPDVATSDPDRVQRFSREAQAIAALNHRNIAAIYDIAEDAGHRFLVLELIEGETLADRLRRGRVPIDEAVSITQQILGALDAAHEKEICHRDLKPANVKIDPEGTVKVLDFGLAKFLSPQASRDGQLSQSPTITVAGTYPGVILGTAGYMSPEQAKGFEADRRSDLFSVGCILYELLTGNAAFDGETPADILASVLKSDADLTQLPPTLNPRLAEILARCLEKNPKKRWQSAADLRSEIESTIGRGATVVLRAAPPSLARRLGWIGAALVAGLMIGGPVAWSLKPDAQRSITRFQIALPAGQQLTNVGRRILALSDDGQTLVYVANERLFVRKMADPEPHEIVGSASKESVMEPAISPDGTMVAYWSDQTLKKISLAGGTPVTLCRASGIFGISWGPDWIVFGQGTGGVMRVAPNGGEPLLIAKADSDELFAYPQMLPDGKSLLFSRKALRDGWDSGEAIVQTADGRRHVVLKGGAAAQYLDSGHLVYAVSGVLRAVPFDFQSLKVHPATVPVIEGVRRGAAAGASTGAAQFVYARNGTAAYVPGPIEATRSGVRDIAIWDRNGKMKPIGLGPAPIRTPRVSPDGKFIAFDMVDDRDASVWIYELDGNTAMRRLTFEGRSRTPVWSPDSKFLIFQSNRDDNVERDGLFLQRADGSGIAERVTTAAPGANHIPQSWSQDGEHVLFSAQTLTGGAELYTLDLKTRQTSPLGIRSLDSIDAMFSPDGRWIAYHQRQSATATGQQVYLQPFPVTGARYLIGDGAHPRWMRKGTALDINVSLTESAIVTVVTTPRVSFGPPARYERGGRIEVNPVNGRRNSDTMPDGERVVGVYTQSPTTDAISGIVRGAPGQFVIVLNWIDELRNRVAQKPTS